MSISRFAVALFVCGVVACKASPAARANATQRTAGAAHSKSASEQRGSHPSGGCPEGMTQMRGFCIDRYEAHLVSPDTGEPHSPYKRLGIGRTYTAESRAGVIPQAYINRLDAEAACRNAGKRLCRAREWAAACQGTPESRCNLGKPHVMLHVFGTRTAFSYDDHYNSPRLNQAPGFLAKTGEHGECTNEHGVFDMVGNLHEWVADDVTPRLAREIDLAYDLGRIGARGNGVFMGGFYSSRGEHGRGCRYVTTHHAPDYHDYSTGFRCCADAPARAGSR